jgi:hypothetical protein
MYYLCFNINLNIKVMNHFILKNYKESPIVILNYNGVSLNGDIEHMAGILNEIFENRDNINDCILQNNNREFEEIIVNNIKFEMDCWNTDRTNYTGKEEPYVIELLGKHSPVNVENFIKYIGDKFGIVSEVYMPHGMIPFTNIEIKNPFKIKIEKVK